MPCYETPNSTSPMIVTTSLNTEGVPTLLETLAALQLPLLQQLASSAAVSLATSSCTSNAITAVVSQAASPQAQAVSATSAFHPVTTSSLFHSPSSCSMSIPQTHLSPTSLPMDASTVVPNLGLALYPSVSIQDCSGIASAAFLPALSPQAPSVVTSGLLTAPPVLSPISVAQSVSLQPSIHISPSFALHNYLEPPVSAYDLPSTSYRRQSAPDGNLRIPMGNHEKRRYSDFTVESLLRQPERICWPLIEKRTASGRKQRTIYGLRQTEVLEEAFHNQRYMVGTEREMLAARLGLSESQVRVWFQNRRSKQRKMSKMVEEEEKKKQQGRAPQDKAQPQKMEIEENSEQMME